MLEMFHKNNNTFASKWWWSIDKVTLCLVLFLIAFGAVMVATTSPAVADRIGVNSVFFIKKQIIHLLPAIIILFGLSFLQHDHIKIFATISLFVTILFMILVLFYGVEVKGARRWISFLGFSLQPSEFIKPLFIIVSGWLLSQKINNNKFPFFVSTMILYVIIVILLILQPDFGMVVTLTTVWGGQLFIAGLSMMWLVFVIIGAVAGVFIAYHLLPHVHKRINNFLNPENTETFQVDRSLDAFASGGLYGKGPGDGVVKQHLPDSHTDFIFAVIGEELGMITCMIIISIFCFIVIRGFVRISRQQDSFILLASSGILLQFALQSFINMGVTVNLLPTKGMTLPFISYGGSSMLATSMAMGLLLGLTRHKYGIINKSKWQQVWDNKSKSTI
jgi:cell division protein FtsW